MAQCLRALCGASAQHSVSAAVQHALCSLGSPTLLRWGHAAGASSSSSCWGCARPFSSSSSSPSSSTPSSSTSASSSNSSSQSSSQAGSSSSTSSTSTSTSTSSSQPSAKSRRQHAAWQRELRAVRAHVFEHQLGNGLRSGRKAILKPLKGRYIADWYFTLNGPKMPMLLDDVEEERQARVETARATGGGPPKKGQGKRAKK